MSIAPDDVIDHLAGIAPGAALAAIRDGRLAARENAQNSYLALFTPSTSTDMALDERFAVAAFVAALHGDPAATAFYAGPLAPSIATAIAAEAARGVRRGPYGSYPSPALSAENLPGPGFQVSVTHRAAIGKRLNAALEHAHMLIFRPRDTDAATLQTLLDAGWSTTGIVTFSQLVAFLTFQLRTVAGLRTLAAMGGA